MVLHGGHLIYLLVLLHTFIRDVIDVEEEVDGSGAEYPTPHDVAGYPAGRVERLEERVRVAVQLCSDEETDQDVGGGDEKSGVETDGVGNVKYEPTQTVMH